MFDKRTVNQFHDEKDDVTFTTKDRFATKMK